MSVNAITSGVRTFLQAQQRMANSAQEISQVALQQGPQSLVEPLIDLRVAERDAKAAARIIETENQMMGTLLDLKV